jgi:hypothetical protein
MENKISKFEILKAVAEGLSFSGAAEKLGISSTWARQSIFAACRELDIPRDLKYIRDNKEDVLERIRCLEETPAYRLPRSIRGDLLEKAGLQSLHQLTPEFVSKVSGARLLESGFSLKSVIAIQQWLESYGLSLCFEKPRSKRCRETVDQAVSLLKVYGFDVSSIESA